MKAFLLTVSVVAVAGLVAYQLGEKFSGVASAVAQSQPDFEWPPRLHETYPDLKLMDQEGEITRLSDYRGKPILIEPIGMSCPGCQAFCGAHERGGYNGVSPQSGLESIDRLVRKHSRFTLSDSEVVHVHLLLYNLNMQAPHPKEAKDWARHFNRDKSKNQLVMVGIPAMIGDASYNMIPGFQLIDRDFVLKVDSTGHHPRHDLFRQLLPQLGSMVRSKDGSSQSRTQEIGPGVVNGYHFSAPPFFCHTTNLRIRLRRGMPHEGQN
jgi:hypothetical protein